MKVVREICVAGPIIEVCIKASSGIHNKKRNPKLMVTKEAVQKNNDRLAGKSLSRLLNANFDKNDWHLTLTYAEAPSPEQAKKELQKFISRAKYYAQKNNLEFKWVVVTEYKDKRIHHHLVTNIDKDVIINKWQHGHVLPRPLDEPPYNKLAEYLIKETTKTFREIDSQNKTRYSHSRNLKIPVIKIEEVSERMLSADPKPIKGYEIIKDSIRKYEHPITGLEHIEYDMIAIASPIEKYKRGRKKKRKDDYKKYINYEERQESLWTRTL